MKYKAIIMVPKVVQFENPGDDKNVGNQAWAMCNNFEQVVMGDEEYAPRLLLIAPESTTPDDQPMVFDPPPMAA